jgi:segregation and condensation protein B
MSDQRPTAHRDQLSGGSAAAAPEAPGPALSGVEGLRAGDARSATEPERRDALCALEAVLFMAAEPLSRDEISEILAVPPAEAEELVRELEADYAGRGIQVSRIAGGYQVATRAEYGPFVAKLHKPERFRLSRAALETLAIVAYKQPVTRPEVDAIRGVNSESPLETLVQYELVREASRKEAPGRPVLYRTTERFLGRFGLDSIADLPKLDAITPSDVVLEAPLPPQAEEEERSDQPAAEGDSGESAEQSA